MTAGGAPPATELPDGARPLRKNISLYQKRNSGYDLPVSPDTLPVSPDTLPVSPDTRGASRSSRTWVEMRWTPIAQLTSARDADGEVVWS
ncbi:hypothetical protein ABIE91_008506 [Bradyrhizobium elkanii]